MGCNFNKSLPLLLLLLALKVPSECLDMVELFSMEDKMENLVKGEPSTDFDGGDSISYVLTPELIHFLKNFPGRESFCDYKCPHFYEIPCFVLFSCRIQIRNFFLILIAPFCFLVAVGVCCGKGLWTLSCWAKYLALFSGLSFVLWFFGKCLKGLEVNRRRELESEYIREQRRGKQEPQVQPALSTSKRLYEQE